MRKLVLVALLYAWAHPGFAADFHVDPVAGHDLLGDGTPASPLLTIGAALNRATLDDHIWCEAGIYSSATNGEAFPLDIPHGVSVHGATNGRTVLRAGGADGLTAAGRGVIEHLTIEGSGGTHKKGIWLAPNGTRSLLNNTVTGFEYGVLMNAVDVDGGGAYVVDGNRFIDNGKGVRFFVFTCDVSNDYIDESVFYNNLFVDNDNGLEIHAECPFNCPIAFGLEPLIWNNTFAFNRDSGLFTQANCTGYGYTDPEIVNNVFAFNGRYGWGQGLFPCSFAKRNSHNVYFDNAVADMADPSFDDGDNLFADPEFISSIVGDYRLRAGSACLDAGDDNPAIVRDLVGITRPLDGDGDLDPRLDPGAHEHRASSTVTVLRRAALPSLDMPITSAFPFDGSNPETPIVIGDFPTSDRDPTPGLLSNRGAALLLYQVDPPQSRALLVVADRAQDTVRFTLR